jgi:hypothetical protein
MEREEFLEYLQSVFDNGLTLEYLVLVRRKNISDVTVVAAYRVEVTDWNTKQEYIDFEIVSSYCPKCYYLRLVSSETLDSGGNGGIETDAETITQNRSEPETPPQTEITPQTKDNTEKSTTENTSEPLENTAAQSSATPKSPVVKNSGKKKREKQRTNVLEKVGRLKEDIQNKTC